MRRLAIAVCLLLCASALAEKKPERLADLSFTVLKDYNGQPIRNAAVVLHPVNKHGKQEASGIELKTNDEGKTIFSGFPYCKLRVQVLVKGFQTFGQDYDISQPVHDITIKLNPPQKQYSVYEDNK